MGRPFEYRWSFNGYRCRAYEAEPGIIRFYQLAPPRDGAIGAETEVNHPIGLVNEFVQIVMLMRGLRCDLAALGAHESSCQECDDYDSESIAACPYCNIPLCDSCMSRWHADGKCREREKGEGK